MRRILSYLKPYRSKLILVFALNIAATLCSLYMPYLMSDIVNNGIADGDIAYILNMGVVMLGASLLAFGCGMLTTKLNANVSTLFGRDLQMGVFRKINSLTFEEYSSIGTSSLLTRSTEDVFAMTDASNMFTYLLATMPILFIGGTVLAFMSDWLLALVLVAMTPLVLLIVWLVTRKMGKLWEQSDLFIDMQNKVVRERLSGIRVIRAFDKEGHEHGRVAYATEEMAKNIIRANVLSGIINPLSILLLNLATVAMLYIGSLRLQVEPLLKAGDIIATIQYVALIMNGLLILSWTIAWFPHLKVSARRVGEVLSLKGLSATAASGERLSGDIRFSGVSFCYPGAETPAVRDLDIDIRDGEIVAIIGGTGSGKTTVVKLLMNFYEATQGSISLGGKPYAALTRETVRDNVSIALQKSMIFEGTIAENIRMGDKDASDARIREVAGIAQILDFVEQQEGAFAYRLSQSGANISGGQKQRIHIARALCKPASVYVFDDSFSALDFLTESRLRKELNRYLDGKTQVVITQRAATAMRCDRVYVMDKGQIVGCGTHDELMASCAIYQEIYASQLGGDKA